MRDPLRRQARERGASAALEWRDVRLTYAQLDAAADELAEALRAAGIGRADVVATALPRRPESVVAVHAISRAGAVLAPTGLGWSGSEWERFAALTRPRAALAPPDRDPPVPGAAADRLDLRSAEAEGPTAHEVSLWLELVRLPPRSGEPGSGIDAGGGEAGSGLDGGAGAPESGPGGGGSGQPLAGTHTLVWTSGSGGAARAVRLTLSNHLASAAAVGERLGLGSGDRWLASLPLAHVGGLEIVWRAAVSGACLVLPGEGSDPAGWWRLVRDAGVTHASLVPTTLHRVLEASDPRLLPAGLRCVLVGGAACPPDLLRRALEARLPVALTYGLTEACSQVATAPPARVREKPGTVGPPLDGTRVRIGPHAEIQVRGPTVMQGYLERTPGASDPWEDGWLRTGDQGSLDEDGDLWVAGRLGSRLVTGGVNVDPQEVEEALAGHPGVREAVVLGLPDPEWGEVVTAVIVARAGASPGEAELADFCRTRLASPKRPRRWLFVPELPRTASGKPDRAAARRLAEVPAGVRRPPPAPTGREEDAC